MWNREVRRGAMILFGETRRAPGSLKIFESGF